MRSKKMYDFLNHPITDLFISILIIVSIIFLLIYKIGTYTVKTVAVFDIIDEIFLIIFSIEFMLKIVFIRGNYFTKGLGWIDLLAATPVFIPLIKIILVYTNVEMAMESDILNITIMFRGMKFIRFLRILRTTRLLKFFTKIHPTETEKATFPISIPIIVSLLFLMAGYAFSNMTENRLKTEREMEMKKIASMTTLENIKTLTKTNPAILIMDKNLHFQRNISGKEYKKYFKGYESSSVEVADVHITYSVKDILRLSQNIETFTIILILIFIISIYLQFKITVKNIHKGSG